MVNFESYIAANLAQQGHVHSCGCFDSQSDSIIPSNNLAALCLNKPTEAAATRSHNAIAESSQGMAMKYTVAHGYKMRAFGFRKMMLSSSAERDTGVGRRPSHGNVWLVKYLDTPASCDLTNPCSAQLSGPASAQANMAKAWATSSRMHTPSTQMTIKLLVRYSTHLTHLASAAVAAPSCQGLPVRKRWLQRLVPPHHQCTRHHHR